MTVSVSYLRKFGATTDSQKLFMSGWTHVVGPCGTSRGRGSLHDSRAGRTHGMQRDTTISRRKSCSNTSKNQSARQFGQEDLRQVRSAPLRSIAGGSRPSAQVVPLAVLWGWAFDRPMSLHFTPCAVDGRTVPRVTGAE